MGSTPSDIAVGSIDTANYNLIGDAATSAAFGVISLIALPLVQTVAQAAADPRVPYFQLLTSRTFIGCCAATFGAYWALSLGLTWFTPFIIKGLGFSQQDAGLISVMPWVFGAAIVLLLKNWASAYIERWNMLLGFVFVFIVIFMPDGLVPGLSRLRARWKGGKR